MYAIVLAFVTAFLVTYFAIPSIIRIAAKRNWVDKPSARRAHSRSTPSLGGIAIFAGCVFSIILWTPFKYFGHLQYILSAFVIIFLIGAKDDIDPISPYKKITGEIFAVLILIFFAKIRITSFYGIFGIDILPYWASVLLTLFVIVLLINAFNLIDGINGLAGSIGVLTAVTFGFWFFLVDRMELASVSFALVGSVTAFLYYNVSPAKIFMGDTGALLIGLVASILAISFIEHHKLMIDKTYGFKAPPAVAVAILIIPLFDTLRVVLTRLRRRKNPFNPDRNHLHHLLLDLGFSHMQSTAILVITNIFFITLAYLFQDFGSLYLLLLMLGIAIFLNGIIYAVLIPKKRKLAQG